MLLNQRRAGACERTSICKEVEKFQLFGASDARRVNLQCLYILAKVLQVLYLCCECFIKKQTVLIFFY